MLYSLLSLLPFIHLYIGNYPKQVKRLLKCCNNLVLPLYGPMHITTRVSISKLTTLSLGPLFYAWPRRVCDLGNVGRTPFVPALEYNFDVSHYFLTFIGLQCRCFQDLSLI